MKPLKAFELKRGMCIIIPKFKSTHATVVVASIKPGRFKSFVHITCIGGKDYQIPRDTEIFVME